MLVKSSHSAQRGGTTLSPTETMVLHPQIWLALCKRACPSFRNAMCENYEVSEVFFWGEGGLAEEGTNVIVLLVLGNNLV